MSRLDYGLLIWGLWGASFIAFEFTSILWSGCPWPTLSSTVRGIEHWSVWIAFVVLVGLVVLTVHLCGAFMPKFWNTITAVAPQPVKRVARRAAQLPRRRP